MMVAIQETLLLLGNFFFKFLKDYKQFAFLFLCKDFSSLRFCIFDVLDLSLHYNSTLFKYCH